MTDSRSHSQSGSEPSSRRTQRSPYAAGPMRLFQLLATATDLAVLALPCEVRDSNLWEIKLKWMSQADWLSLIKSQLSTANTEMPFKFQVVRLPRHDTRHLLLFPMPHFQRLHCEKSAETHWGAGLHCTEIAALTSH